MSKKDCYYSISPAGVVQVNKARMRGLSPRKRDQIAADLKEFREIDTPHLSVQEKNNKVRYYAYSYSKL